MLSFSYKSFLIMDQLRRRAGISVPQFLHVLDIDIATYSRISARVYAEHSGVLHYDIEKKVRHGLDVLTSCYEQNLISPTTLKKKEDVISTLKRVELEMTAKAYVVLIDCDIHVLLRASNTVLIT